MKQKRMKKTQTVLVFTRLTAEIHSFPRIDISVCLEKMLEAVPLMGMKAVGSGYSRNPPCAYVLLATSHMALHLFDRPEQRFAYLDIFTCGNANVRAGYEHLKQQIEFHNDTYRMYSETKRFPRSSES